MTSKINDEIFNEILYEESFWTGKKRITINGTVLEKANKKEYLLKTEEGVKYFTLGGNFLSGAQLFYNERKIQLTPPAKWYEILLSVITFVIVFAWSLSPNLVAIFPVVGGAIGGAIMGACVVVNLLLMKMVKNPLFKILIWLGMTLVTFGVCGLIGLQFLAALA